MVYFKTLTYFDSFRNNTKCIACITLKITYKNKKSYFKKFIGSNFLHTSYKNFRIISTSTKRLIGDGLNF